ncbi:MAG TPA: hypothetical protein VF712_00880 [Thermoleophilaceae bacterium]
MTLPSDASSLLVPVHLDVWCVNQAVQNAGVVMTYQAQYENLAQLESPIAASTGDLPDVGVHLHWALPDALTHGRKADAASPLAFPLVPNRWLVARFEATPSGPPNQTAWVVQSDFIGTGSQGTSPFLNPSEPSTMTVAGTTTTFTINQVNLGTSEPAGTWQEPGSQQFLTATGPANVSFAAYAGFVRDVFAFVDGTVPAQGAHTYTYMVVGWYSDPAAADPLRGLNTFIPGVWKDEATWAEQTPAERFEAILADARWAVAGDPPAAPPATSLYHATAVGVQYPPPQQSAAPPVGSEDVVVALGNTSTDALAALVQAYAQLQAKEDPKDAAAWTAAGSELAGLVQAAMYDLLDVYGTPGGSVLLQQGIEDAWFGSSPGGTAWDAVGATPQAAGDSEATPRLTPGQSAALAKQLAQLNSGQRTLDEARRQLASLQETLYGMWLRVGRANTFGWGQAPTTEPPWNVLHPFMQNTIYPGLVTEVTQQLGAVRSQAEALPDPTDPAEANAWAEQHWTFPSADGKSTTTLAGLGLALKAGADARFWHPTDPVVMLSGANRAQKHGEDGLNPDGTMPCRLPGQAITGVHVGGQPDVTVAALQAKGLAGNILSGYTQVPSVPGLVAEAFVADPANAQAMATALGADQSALETGIADLVGGAPEAGSGWDGVPPAPFALAAWSQAWSPLYMEWEVTYYPTGSGTGQGRPFSLDDWSFDGQDMHWRGTGFELDDALTYAGRTLLTPHAPLLFKDKIEAYLKAHTTLDTAQMEELIGIVGGWDVLAQTLSGFTDQLITLLAQETFPPTSAAGGDDISTLVGEQYRFQPITSRTRGANVSTFYPLRGGILQIDSLRIVDAYGQMVTLDQQHPNTPQGFIPLLGQGLTPEAAPPGLPAGAAELPPRVVQDTRLDFRFLANDGSGLDVAVSPNPNPVCGWLLPNHLDGGVAVYDGDGTMLGELIPLEQPDNWRPRPGAPVPTPPPASPADIPNPTLRAVVESMASQTVAVFEDVLGTIDETLWMVDPLGGRKDQFLSVLIGRPLAVVQAQLGLSLMGAPAFDQTWNAMATPTGATSPAQCTWTQEAGDVGEPQFPVRLGDLDVRADGLVGYYLPSEAYSTFHTVHLPDEVSAGDTYLKQIATARNGGSPQYQGDLALQVNAAPTTVTLVLDPRGPVHAFTGILPVTTAALAPRLVEDFVKQLAITFRTGPVLADPGALRIPLPGRQHGAWDWIQAIPGGWEQDPIVAADDVARLPDAQLELREGWLRLTKVDDSGGAP